MSASLLDRISWDNAVADLTRRATEFMEVLSAVNATGQDIIDQPDLRQQRAQLIERAGIIKTTIQKTTAGIDYVYRTYDKIFEGSTLPIQGMGYLGLIPLVPVAVVAGATAAVAYWVSDAKNFVVRVNAMRDLRRQGIDPATAQSIVDNNTGILSTLKKAAPWVVGGGAVFFILRRKGII